MGYMLLLSDCVGCGSRISANPDHVPSLTINGNREPLCKACFDRWNDIHRTKQGLKPIPLHPNAYDPQEAI